ncbi:MAG TPA: alpha/beta fold hydrolase [Burkholderiaceae bacterium]|nr:alpha/beta fold hydrolase [Burkholderiaceae bacterium]
MSSPSILPGAEPFFLRGNDIGVLVCHGYTGSTQSMRPLGQALHGAGFTVAAPRLAGHGTTPQDMAATGAGDWIASVETALAQLREVSSKIFIVGLSMGGTLTLYTAAKHPDIIRGAITINAPVLIGSPDLAGLALDPLAPELIPGVGSDIKAPNTKELAYEQLPVATLRQIYALTAVTLDLLPRVKCPALVMQSREDHIVHAANASTIMSQLGSSRIEMLWLNNSYHVATLDNDKDLIAQQATAFIRSI